MQATEFWPIAVASYTGILDNHYLQDKLLDFANEHDFVFPKITSFSPIENALMVFTDGSSTGMAVYVCNDATLCFQNSFFLCSAN